MANGSQVCRRSRIECTMEEEEGYTKVNHQCVVVWVPCQDEGMPLNDVGYITVLAFGVRHLFFFFFLL